MLNGYKVLNPRDANFVNALYAWAVKHRKKHPSNVKGCSICEEFFGSTFTGYYGQYKKEKGTLLITVRKKESARKVLVFNDVKFKVRK